MMPIPLSTTEKLESYEVFPWNDHFLLKIPHIDKQHKKLVQILNNLCGHLALESNRAETDKIIQELLDYTVYHFNYEEVIWRSHFELDEEYINHKHDHESFKEKVLNLKFDQESKTYQEVVAETISFLVRWLTSHILGSDMRLSKIVLAMDKGIPLEEAKIIAQNEMLGAKSLINSVLDMYDRLTARTLLLMQERVQREKINVELLASKQQEKAFTDNIMSNNPGIIYLYDKKLKIIRFNNKLSEVTSYSDEELSGMYLSDLFSEKDYATLLDISGRDKHSSSRVIEINLKCKNGNLIPHIFNEAPLEIEGKTYIGAAGIDISAQKQAEKKLMESEERYRSIADSSSVAMIIVIDQNGNVISWNPAAARTFGYSEAEILNHPLKELMPERYRTAHVTAFQRAVTSEKYRIIGKTIELYGLKKNGEEFPIELSLSTWVQDGKKYFSGIIHDITERKRAEKEIARFSRIFEDTLNEIYLFDVDSLKFVQANNAALHNIGYTLEELRELTPFDITSDFTTETFAELVAPLRKGERGSVVFEAIHQRKDGSLYDIEVHLQLLSHEHEKLFVVIIMDITDKKKQESILHQAQKMEAVGQLTGGIAHDFNNLLSIISGNLRFLKEDLGKTSEAIDELFEDATSAVGDGAELTQRLLGFSRTKILHPEYRNVNDSIEKSVRFLSRTLADNTELETVLPDEMLYINVDPSQLENALLNLCINARDAMAGGGTITISAERYYHGSDDTDEYSLSLPEGDYVKISVTDTGTGISPEDMQHVYEPFFTTKEIGKGSGLGLSMVFGFTQQSQGACHIESSLGEGTMVSVYFPEVIESRGVDRPPRDAAELSLHGSGVILVVEDEPRVRRVALRELRKLGYQTLEAENAEVAKTIIESGEHIDLLFSDILMPGEMDGHMLAVWTQEHYPEIKIVLTSGYTKGKTEAKEDKAHRFPLLRKPCSIEKLARQVRTTLEV